MINRELCNPIGPNKSYHYCYHTTVFPRHFHCRYSRWSCAFSFWRIVRIRKWSRSYCLHFWPGGYLWWPTHLLCRLWRSCAWSWSSRIPICVRIMSTRFPILLTFCYPCNRPAVFSSSSQPRSLATTSDSAIVIAENSSIEVIKSNQKVFDITSPKFTPSSAAALGSTVAIGGEDMKVRLYEWDGKTLKENGTLENNKGVVSALAFSPDGAWLAAGDVSQWCSSLVL